MNMDFFLQTSRFLIAIIAPWTATGLLVLSFGIIISYLPSLIGGFKNLRYSTKIILLATILAGTCIRFAWVPMGHRIYFDEDRYLSYAVNFARHGQAVSLILSTPEKVVLGDPDPAARITVPVINAWTLKIFGYTEQNLFFAAKVWSIFQIILFFIVVYLLFDDQDVALFSAFVLSFLPISVYWSVSSNIDLYFVTFSLLALTATILYVRTRTIRTILFLWSTVVLLLLVRFESFLFLPPILFTIISFRKLQRVRLFSGDDIPIAILLVPIIFLRALISVPVFSNIWCCAEATPLEIFTTEYFFRNTIPNVFTFVDRPEFPASITVLAIIAFFSTRSSKKNQDYRYRILAIWIILFFFIYSYYYAGQFYSYTFSGSYGRFFLMEVAPLTILSALAVRSFVEYFRKARFEQRNWMLLACLILIISLAPTVISYKKLISVSPWDRIVEAGPRRLHAYIDDVMLPKTPPDSAIIFGVLAPVHLNGKTAIYTDNFLNDSSVMDFVADYIHNGKPVFIFETHTCDIYPKKCTDVFNRFSFEPYSPTTDPKFPGFEMKQVVLKKI